MTTESAPDRVREFLMLANPLDTAAEIEAFGIGLLGQGDATAERARMARSRDGNRPIRGVRSGRPLRV